MRRIARMLVSSLALAASLPAAAQDGSESAERIILEDGTVVVRSFQLPPSAYLSPEARDALPREPVDQMAQLSKIADAPDPAAIRKLIPQAMKPQIDTLKSMYGVKTVTGTLGGVGAVFFEPAAGVPQANRDKILLNLPGGGFVAGHAGGTGSVESIPLSAMAGVRIASITYRQAPENQFPAASEDVAAAYRELLKTHKPEDIGIFGCSAGGLLAAQSMAWFLENDLPLPGALGIFCASADAEWKGDSRIYNRPFEGLPEREDSGTYYGSADRSQPLASPVNDPEMLAQFPPTLLITGSRAFEASSAMDTQKELVLAGADATISVWDGLGHAFFYDSRLPESREAFTVMADFFAEHLDLQKPVP